jgi:hypothetical protein
MKNSSHSFNNVRAYASLSGVIQLNCANLNVTYVGLGSCLLMALVQDAVKAHSSL